MQFILATRGNSGLGSSPKPIPAEPAWSLYRGYVWRRSKTTSGFPSRKKNQCPLRPSAWPFAKAGSPGSYEKIACSKAFSAFLGNEEILAEQVALMSTPDCTPSQSEN